MNTKLVQKMKELPKTPGVYIFRDQNHRVIYVGKAVVLRNRVPSYFAGRDHDPKTIELVKRVESLEWIEVESEFEALILEADLIKRYKPKYNIRFRDDKNYSYIKISGDEYPKISVVHQITDHTAEHIGPFIESTGLRTILKLTRHIYPYCTCSLPKDQTCLYFHLKLCPGHGEKYISRADYMKNIRGIKAIFSGKTKKIEGELKVGMDLAAKEQKYEKAGEFRDKLYFVKKIQRAHLFSDRELSHDAGLRELAKELGLTDIPKRIECFDISNIMGTAATGSMAVFLNGVASPREYRRFQIKKVKGANDVASMAEVLGRRFTLSSVKKKDRSFSSLPNLVVLDGGKGQLATVVKNVTTPEAVNIISIAKKREEIYTIEGNTFQKHILPKGSEALFLIQRLRDEAHRFAITYHRKVRSKEMFQSSLDSIPGVGPKTKKKLLSHFGSIKRIKAAALSDLASVVGEKIAKGIKENI
jgi:excinuclease ABC subunit C